jgi:hypothetical protein
MTRNDIIRMAENAELIRSHHNFILALGKFANLVAAAEREACCKIVYGQCESDNVAQRTVDAIRERGDK